MPFDVALAPHDQLDQRVDNAISFTLEPARIAQAPAEVRGLGRDDVRLLVTPTGQTPKHARFAQLPEFLEPGDLVVFNRSATLPASLAAQRADGSSIRLHLSTRLPADLCVVEPRGAQLPTHERLRLAANGIAELLTPYRDSTRLWIARLYLPVSPLEYLAAHGEPIMYGHMTRPWPLDMLQNIYATEPGSAEMPSAGRPFTWEMLGRLRRKGVALAALTLHAGVSSLQRGEPPYEESFCVPAQTAEALRWTRRRGGRVLAVGITVVRALESSIDARGQVVATQGWTDLYITPERGVRTVDGILTGFHEPESSHLSMLEAIAGADTIRTAYAAALADAYLWHEFGDSNLIWR